MKVKEQVSEVEVPWLRTIKIWAPSSRENIVPHDVERDNDKLLVEECIETDLHSEY